jgi:hypothetical protein
MWAAAMRIQSAYEGCNGQKTVILHLGDHDPSGIDMSRDIEERIQMFLAEQDNEEAFGLYRIALNMDQVKYYNPPPNPAKTTDSRFKSYINYFGEESWELDALEPNVLINLITENATKYIDRDLWDEAVDHQESGRRTLYQICDNYDNVKDYVEGMIE